jgi:hypothetical protein
VTDPCAFFYQPDPQRQVWVMAKPMKLVRRGARHFYLVGTMPDGAVVKLRLAAGSLDARL